MPYTLSLNNENLLYVKVHQLYRRVHRERTFHHRHLRDHRHHHPVVRSSRTCQLSTITKCRSWRYWNLGRGNGRIGLAWWKRSRAARRSSTSSVTTGVHPWSRGWTRSRPIQQVIVEISSIPVGCLRDRIFLPYRKCPLFKKRNRRKEKLTVLLLFLNFSLFVWSFEGTSAT